MQKYWYFIIILLIVAVISVFIYFNYIAPRQIYKYAQEKLGELEDIKCWSYGFISGVTKYYGINQSLSSSEKVKLLREKLNENYTEFINGTFFKDNPKEFILFVSQFPEINLVETIYLIVKDVPEYLPENCAFTPEYWNEKNISTIMFLSTAITESGEIAYDLTTTYIRYCINATDLHACNENFTKTLDLFTNKIKNSLPEFKIRNDTCPQNHAYFDVKNVEEKLREQLNGTYDSFSRFWKSLLVDTYSYCSEKVYFETKNITCSLVTSKTDAVGYVTASYGILISCSIERLNTTLNSFESQLT